MALHKTVLLPIRNDMVRKDVLKPSARCAYLKACYLAEELKCFGYKTDCPLYQKSNGEYYHPARFDEAMNKLIDKTRAKHERIDSK